MKLMTSEELKKVYDIVCPHYEELEKRYKQTEEFFKLAIKENKRLKAENEDIKNLSKYIQQLFDEVCVKRDKLQEENQRLKAENETLRIENVSRELRKLFTESRVKQPETCAVSGVKLNNPALREAERIIKFRLGDRVAVHSKDRDTFRATIFNMHHNKIYVIEDGFYSAHDDNPFLPSQCRKLRKVKK